MVGWWAAYWARQQLLVSGLGVVGPEVLTWVGKASCTLIPTKEGTMQYFIVAKSKIQSMIADEPVTISCKPSL